MVKVVKSKACLTNGYLTIQQLVHSVTHDGNLCICICIITSQSSSRKDELILKLWLAWLLQAQFNGTSEDVNRWLFSPVYWDWKSRNTLRRWGITKAETTTLLSWYGFICLFSFSFSCAGAVKFLNKSTISLMANSFHPRTEDSLTHWLRAQERHYANTRCLVWWI